MIGLRHYRDDVHDAICIECVWEDIFISFPFSSVKEMKKLRDSLNEMIDFLE